MKTRKMKVGKLLQTGLCCVVALGLLSCGGDDKKELENAGDELASVSTEETATFGGSALSESERVLRENFMATNYFEKWDKNNDNLLDQNEHANAFFNTWDTNGNNSLEQNEWDSALKDFGLADDNAWAWSGWNMNQDSNISQNEFTTQLTQANIFGNWDTNGDMMLDENEYVAGLFGLWNKADADGELDENEYNNTIQKYFDTNDKAYMPERG